MSDVYDIILPSIKIDVKPGRPYLAKKTLASFKYIYANYYNDYDWFLKADDDTYVVMENLRYFLSKQSKRRAVYFGHHFKLARKQGYFGGGAGYVLSKGALGRFGKYHAEKCYFRTGPEDIMMGMCMENLGVKAGDTRDALGRSRFHSFSPGQHIQGGYPKWYMHLSYYNTTRVGKHNSRWTLFM